MKTLGIFLIVSLSILVFISCNNSGSKGSDQEVELKKKELELKERELALKEKELANQNSVTESSPGTSEVSIVDKNKAFYIINVAAVTKESEAKSKVQKLANDGYESGYLWIPDYASLSGAKFYSVYIGPYATQYECEVSTEEYRKTHPDAYGLLVSQDNKRVQINGIGKITVTEKSNDTATITIESFSKTPEGFIGAGSWYSKTKNGMSIFLSDVSGNAVMKLNGKTVKLTWVEKNNTYVNADYEVIIDTKVVNSGHEYQEEEGYMTVKAKDGAIVKQKVFGGWGA